jgi:hypothetical protein
MTSSPLFNLLVPDAPRHRRTERDALPSVTVEARVRSEVFLREIIVKPGLQKPRLVSSCTGTIKTIMLALPTDRVADPKSAPGYQSVIAALRQGTRFIVVHHPSDRPKIEEWFSKAGHANDAVIFVPMPEFVSFTDWAEDGYVAVSDEATGNAYLVEPWEFPRGGDALIADAAEGHTSIRSSQAPLGWELSHWRSLLASRKGLFCGQR